MKIATSPVPRAAVTRPRPARRVAPPAPEPRSAAVEIPAHRVGRPLAIGDFARYIGYSIDAINDWVETGEVEVVKPPVRGARPRVSWATFERFAHVLKITIRTR